jgi:sugar phosphate permease
MALGSSLGGFLSITVALVNWFSRHRAKALALSQIGFSIGGLMVPLTVVAMEAFGWRATAFGSGLLVMAIGLPLTAVIRHAPHAYGQRPDGAPATQDEDTETALDGSADFTAREAMRTRAFWYISLGHASALLVVSAVMVHVVVHVNESLGYSLSQAAGIIALMTVMQLVGQIGGGFLGDRFSKRFIVVGCMAGHAAALLLLAYATGLGMVIAFAVLHGLAWGTRGPLMQAIRADYFGTRSFGTIMGFSSLIIMLGMTSGPIFAGFMADRTGSYESGFTVLALGALAGSLFFVLSPKPPPPRRAATPAANAEPARSPASVQAGDSGGNAR